MNTRLILISALATLTWTGAGCNNVDCGDGTVERDGKCAPAETMIGNAQCGPFTTLQGNMCVPMFPPTECEDGTTTPDLDPATGVTTCKGTGTTGGCMASLACPNPANGKQTICGRFYNLEDNAPFQATAAMGSKCPSTPTADGPCALSIRAFDALQFGGMPGTAVPLTVGEVYIDDCGRYRVTDITLPSGPFIGLGIDDAVTAMAGPAGVTNTTGVATAKTASMATRDFEAFVAPKSTTDKWIASGAPPLGNAPSAFGYYLQIFRGHRTGLDGLAGVQSLRSGNPNTANDSYFTPNELGRTTIAPAATTTGMNGTALVINASTSELLAYSGSGGLPPECTFETKAGAAVAGSTNNPPNPPIVFVQIYRPVNAVGETCPL